MIGFENFLLSLDKPTVFFPVFISVAMKKSDLLENFIHALKLKYPKKNELVSVVENTLKIERESASRRLNGKVMFSIRDIGILAYELDISLDDLLQPEECNSIPFIMQGPFTAHSMDVLVDQMQKKVNRLEGISNKTLEVGSIFNSLPAEFYIPYPFLSKFMIFKWGHYFIGSKEYDNFELWETPKEILDIHDQMLLVHNKYKKVICFWDISLIWNIAKDLEYFFRIHAINQSDVKLIKEDLLDMLSHVEVLVKGTRKRNSFPEIQFYILSVHVGMTYSYFFSNTKCAISFYTYFMRSLFSENHETCIKVRDWIISMKKVSTLISGSGERERVLFFEEQRKIINNIQA